MQTVFDVVVVGGDSGAAAFLVAPVREEEALVPDVLLAHLKLPPTPEESMKLKCA